MSSRLAASMKELRDRALGHPTQVAKCEYFNTFINRRVDLFNIFDLIWLSMSTDGTDGQIVGIQVVNTHLQDHIDKIEASPAARHWVACGGGIVIHEWKKSGPRGKRKTWKLTEHEIIWTRNDKGEVEPWKKSDFERGYINGKKEAESETEISTRHGGPQDRGVALSGPRLRRGSR